MYGLKPVPFNLIYYHVLLALVGTSGGMILLMLILSGETWLMSGLEISAQLK